MGRPRLGPGEPAGYPPMKGAAGAVFVAAGAAFLFAVYPSEKTPSAQPSPAPVAAKQEPKQKDPKEAEQERLWRRDVLNVRVLRKSLHNPDSFRLEQALRMKDGSLCLTYRATNAFGGIVLNHAVIRSDRIIATGHPDHTRLWNLHCGGKTGENVTHLRQAL